MAFLENAPIPQPLISVLVIILVAYAVQRIAMFGVGRAVRRTVRASHFKTKKDEAQREDTLISILAAAVRVGVWIVAFFMILGELGVEVGPLLAGAGVLGVALGFGAQSLVKDYLAGIFVIAENQYRVGDVLQVNQDVSGLVERVTLRATVLRDLDGVVHYIPNGVIEIASNMSMEYANMNINVGVAYNTDIDKLEKVINKVGEELFEDSDWKDAVLEPPYMLRVDEFADSAINVKILCKTAPIRQWDVKGEYMRRLKKAFEKANIEIPFPQRVIHDAKR